MYSNFMTILVKYFPFHSLCIFQSKVQNILGNCQNMKILDGLSMLNEGSIQGFKLTRFLAVALSHSHSWLASHYSATSLLESWLPGFLLVLQASSANIIPSDFQCYQP